MTEVMIDLAENQADRLQIDISGLSFLFQLRDATVSSEIMK
jgi:hypothetical protein